MKLMYNTNVTPAEPIIPDEIGRQVLLIGPDYRNYRGGIGSVLAVYQKHIGSFQFLASYKYFNRVLPIMAYFALHVVQLTGKLLTDRAIKIVHLHGSTGGSFYRKFTLFLLIRYVFRRQVIYHIHADDFPTFYTQSPTFIKRAIRHFINRADAVVCLSQTWHRYFSTQFSPQKLFVVNNVVQPPALGWQPNYTRQSSTVVRPLQLLFLGEIGHRKGIFDVVDMLHTHKAALAGRIKLTIGGNGETDHLVDQIRQYGLETMIDFVGWVSGEQKQTLLQQADVFLLPSYSEGLPMSILEAMSYGLPIISTPVGGIPEVVTDGVNGFLVSPGDQNALYRAVNQFVANPLLIAQFGELSAQRSINFQPEQVFCYLSDIYQSLVGRSTVVSTKLELV